MRSIVDAITAAANLAYLVHGESVSLDLKMAAERTLNKLHVATDRIIELKEVK